MSVPLLLERSIRGMGPKVPTRTAFNSVVVEGLSDGDSVALFVDTLYADGFTKDGEYSLEKPIERNKIVQAKLIGNNSKVSVRLEKK